MTPSQTASLEYITIYCKLNKKTFRDSFTNCVKYYDMFFTILINLSSIRNVFMTLFDSLPCKFFCKYFCNETAPMCILGLDCGTVQEKNIYHLFTAAVLCPAKWWNLGKKTVVVGWVGPVWPKPRRARLNLFYINSILWSVLRLGRYFFPWIYNPRDEVKAR